MNRSHSKNQHSHRSTITNDTLLKYVLIFILLNCFIIFYYLHFGDKYSDDCNKTKKSIINIQTNGKNRKSDIPMPSLIIIGPPKSGTTTLTHTFGDMSNWIRYPGNNGENHWWNGSNKYRCLPSKYFIGWNSFIKLYSENKISLLVLNKSIKYLCPVEEYINMIINVCIDNNLPIKNDTYYYIESSPTYQRNPLIPISTSLYLPKTKLLQSLRNPISFIWSWLWHFYPRSFKKTDPQHAETHLHWKFTIEKPNSETYSILTNYCKRINNITQSNYNDKHIKRDAILKEMMIKYLEIRFIENKWEPVLRRDAYIFASNYLVTFLFYIYVYDEVYGYNNWNQYKLIQFEWLFTPGNTGKAIKLIREWVMDEYDVKHSIFNQNEYNKLEKKEHKATVKYSEDYKKRMEPVFADCNHVLLDIILNERPNLLIGEWIDWGY